MKAKEVTIRPQSGFQLINFNEIYQYRDILFLLVLRDLKVLYAQTVLGFSWAILRPFISMVVFSLVFGVLAGMPSDGIPYPVFAYTALLPWTYFASSYVKSSESLVANTSTWTKVYFPRLLLPFVPIFSSLIDFIIAAFMLAALMLFYGVPVTQNIVFLPLLILLMILTSSGVGMWLSALAVQYRDVRYANQFVSQLLMYAAPVVWPVSLIAEKFPENLELLRIIYGFYPMVGVIEGFRASLLGSGSMPWDLIVSGYCSALVIFIGGALYFRNRERIFADVA